MFAKGSLVIIKENGKEGIVKGHIIHNWLMGENGFPGSKLLALVHYLDDPDPYSFCFLGEDKLSKLDCLFDEENDE